MKSKIKMIKKLKVKHGEIRFEGVDFSYGENQIFHNLKLHIKPSQKSSPRRRIWKRENYNHQALYSDFMIFRVEKFSLMIKISLKLHKNL